MSEPTPRAKAYAAYAERFNDGLDNLNGEQLRDEIAKRSKEFFGKTLDELEEMATTDCNHDLKMAYTHMTLATYYKESIASTAEWQAERDRQQSNHEKPITKKKWAEKYTVLTQSDINNVKAPADILKWWIFKDNEQPMVPGSYASSVFVPARKLIGQDDKVTPKDSWRKHYHCPTLTADLTTIASKKDEEKAGIDLADTDCDLTEWCITTLKDIKDMGLSGLAVQYGTTLRSGEVCQQKFQFEVRGENELWVNSLQKTTRLSTKAATIPLDVEGDAVMDSSDSEDNDSDELIDNNGEGFIIYCVVQVKSIYVQGQEQFDLTTRSIAL
jgi:hypothetical protein